MPKLTKFTDLFDEQSEVMAWIVLFLGIFGFVGGLGDWPSVAMVTLSCFLMGFIRRLKAGPSGLDITRD